MELTWKEWTWPGFEVFAEKINSRIKRRVLVYNTIQGESKTEILDNGQCRPGSVFNWTGLCGAAWMYARSTDEDKRSRPSSFPSFTNRKLLTTALTGTAAQPAASGPYVPKQNDRPEPVAGEEPGFESIFDGKTLSGWTAIPNMARFRA